MLEKNKFERKKNLFLRSNTMRQAEKPASETCWIGCLLASAEHLAPQNMLYCI